ncbi:hypothetical protein ISN44_As02g004300 [Arabidopsis suecica]|uniref:Uncharacterized protein At2g05500 n=2 Tax=Arabidopsis TaxID=3701 RepID=Q9SL17_ARATH|nr:hypothetical protein [Arabidopsis thaliana]KAG7640582.1 hypothetical protein ISN44_As02g004300 [Arabidopsis suecica]
MIIRQKSRSPLIYLLRIFLEISADRRIKTNLYALNKTWHEQSVYEDTLEIYGFLNPTKLRKHPKCEWKGEKVVSKSPHLIRNEGKCDL